MEVLISTFVLSVGLLSLSIALFPAGRFAVVEAGRADRAGACGRAALREVRVRRMLDPHTWNPPPAPRHAFVIDPLGTALGAAGTFGGTTIRRISLKGCTNLPAAEAIFIWKDDLVFDVPEDRDLRPGLLDGAVAPKPAGHYTWFLTVGPSLAEADLIPGFLQKRLYTVSAVVCYGRDFAAGEQTFDARFLGNNGYGGGSVELSGPVEIHENDWIALCGTKPPADPAWQPYAICKWYRVVSVGESPTTWLTLSGPDWETDPAKGGDPNPKAVVIDRVVGVYTTTVELDQDPRWIW